jgi:uncharacterized protein YbjT (DUF2867 family)
VSADDWTVVAGATGYLGGFVVKSLARRGLRVRALARGDKAVPGAGEVFHGDATSPESLRGLCDGARTVFSSLGITRQKDRVTFDAVDYGANKNVIEEAVRAKVKRFVFVSVVRPELFGESALVQARERFVRELRKSSVSSCVVRATGFFNDLKEPFEMAKRGRVWLVGDGQARINPVHGADLAEACSDALESKDSEVDVGGPHTYTWNEIAALAFDALGKPAKVSHLPQAVVGALLPPVKLFSRRSFDIARFVATVAVNDIVAPERGEHDLGDFYRELARDLRE